MVTRWPLWRPGSGQAHLTFTQAEKGCAHIGGDTGDGLSRDGRGLQELAHFLFHRRVGWTEPQQVTLGGTDKELGMGNTLGRIPRVSEAHGSIMLAGNNQDWRRDPPQIATAVTDVVEEPSS